MVCPKSSIFSQTLVNVITLKWSEKQCIAYNHYPIKDSDTSHETGIHVSLGIRNIETFTKGLLHGMGN